MTAGQKRAPDPITDGCEPICGCWELNSGPMEEQAMLLTSEPSLQPLAKIFFLRFIYYLYNFLPPHARGGCQIFLQMVCSHHVVAGN